MTGTLKCSVRRSRRISLARNLRKNWRDKLFGLGVLYTTFGVAIAAITGAYEWQMLTVLAAGLTAMLGSVVVGRDMLQLQYRSTRFALTFYVFSTMLVGMTWAGAFTNTSDVLNVLWYGLIAWGLTVVFFWMPAKRKPSRVVTFATVIPDSRMPW